MDRELLKRRIAEIGLALVILAGGFFVLQVVFDTGEKIIDKDTNTSIGISEQDALRENILSVGGEIVIPVDVTPDPEPLDLTKRIYPAAQVFQLRNERPITLEEAQHDYRLMQELRRQQEELLAALDLENHEPKGSYFLEGLESLGSVNAQSFLAGDLDTGEIIFERRADEVYPIASVSKYFTAYTAAKFFDPNEVARVDEGEFADGSNRGGFSIGDKLTIRELLYPLLLVSANEAAEIIARQRDRSEFMSAMNAVTTDLHLDYTHFEDPTGLSKENTSTARDLFEFMRVIKTDYPQIVAISGLSNKSINQFTWYNINKAQSFSEFRGGKTGFTNAARQTSIGYYEITLTNGMTKNIGMVILQSNTRQQDTRNVLDYLKNSVVYLENQEAIE